ncbi:phosphoribosylaminoimidazolesuccinocarboxamide synthase [Planococcus sp. CP5-4]|uniref:phosphoribosylaminoimidazolesuccinocarboxamide synthase n=1 Tax=unclassified Planococcus (in: firmicutes) TaxID=2662419 RepID=UPI001C24607A|nr:MULTISPECIES: phosphoribosylaminoimidazolesuccinocarboxamide synthase [unclassified Planococcus (in: firmicutes)]MBU9674892.1 phosphoribosylaminoimidazolesuccinocarboxamide synthase [Planococcus sp. CP5-4_YE]MBV0910478.1 phosphoribosylaminoimidazolesuccinocarboxamide synthase [Planococcus sp. CP5-4_UN]MBW6065321.1 phosphoribosylaminoimidazolesuccinocarboxamide synthase [Planococcus sp. CP5-4]
MEKAQLLYEGKAKRLYKTDEQGILWVEYKDSATAFNGEKKEEISGKGRLNNQITSLLFEKLKANSIASHFVKQLSDSEQLVREVSIVPIEVVVRNIVAGSMAKRLGLDEGKEIEKPVVEFYLKDDELGDPLITDDHVAMLQLATEQEVAVLKDNARKINDVLIGFFQEIGVDLVDFKIEFGRDENGEILLADEISPDTCRLWDKETKQKLDKDVFRRNLGNLTDAYELILSRLGGQN